MPNAGLRYQRLLPAREKQRVEKRNQSSADEDWFLFSIRRPPGVRGAAESDANFGVNF